jgi:hypothetical protein
MTPAFFDTGLHRAIMGGKVACPLGNGRWSVTSASTPEIVYLTTETTCSCLGHERHGRCCCRCLVIFEAWYARQHQVATPRPAA